MSKPTPEQLRTFSLQLCDTLPAAYKRSLAGEYDQLLSAHQQMIASQCFLVGTHCYFANQNVYHISRVSGNPPALDPSLFPAFKAWEKSINALTHDLQRISQTIDSILLRARDWQDVRNMFPEHFIRPVLNLWFVDGTQRTTLDLHAGPSQPFAAPSQEQLDREAVWDPRLVKMYGQVGGLIDLYLGYKLI